MKMWRTKGFDAFRRGLFGNGGQNLYVSRKGVLQRIYQFDFTRNGWFDLPFANCQNHYSRSCVGFDKLYLYTGSAEGYSPERRLELPAWCAVDSLGADLDDDGWAELVVCNNSENSIDLDPGHFIHHFGPEGFDPARTVALKTDLGWGCACGDFKHRGFLDLATSCSHWKNIRVFENGPDGYTSSYDIDLHGMRSPRWILAADLNRNGWLDLIVPLINADRTLIFHGGPDGFRWEDREELAVLGGSCARVADLTGNGYPDLIIGTHVQTPKKGELVPHQPHHSYLHIYWNGPEGLSERNSCILRCDAADAICVADFDRDGRLDIFAGSYHNGVERDIPSFIYWNRDGKFSDENCLRLPTHSASGCVAADFNEDGWGDLAVANHKIYGDHLGFSSVWYNGPEGFDRRRRTDLPIAGPHGIASNEPGNALTRGAEEYYTSPVFDCKEYPSRPVSATIQAEIPENAGSRSASAWRIGQRIWNMQRGASGGNSTRRARRGSRNLRPRAFGSMSSRWGRRTVSALRASPKSTSGLNNFNFIEIGEFIHALPR